MSKTLLKEHTVRRFMKLANIDSLTDEFVKNTLFEQVDEEDLGGPPMEDLPPEGPPVDDLPVEDELGEVGGDQEVTLSDEEARILIELGERLSEAMGGEELELGGEELELGGEELGGEELGGEEFGLPPEEEEFPLQEGQRRQKRARFNKKQLVERVLANVTKRLLESRE